MMVIIMQYVNWKKNEIVKFMVKNDLKFVIYQGIIFFNKEDYEIVKEFLDKHRELGIPVFPNTPLAKILVSRV